MAVREGKWDCSDCLTTRIKGRLKACPNCGNPRNPTLTPEEKPYLPTDAEVITDSSLLDLAKAGPDWSCGHCGEANRGDATVCAHCERPRDADDTFSRVSTYVEGKSAKGVVLDAVDTEERERVEDLTSDYDEHLKLMSDNPDEPDRPAALTLPASALRRDGELATRVDGYLEDRAERASSPLSFRWDAYRLKIAAAAVAGVGALVLVVYLVYGAFFKTEPVTLEVTSLTWERQVEIEEFRTLVEQGWQLPSGGRLIRSFEDIHHYDQVLDHYETESYQVAEEVYVGTRTEDYACGSRTVDNGNGFFETETEYCTRSVPEYRTEYRTEYREIPVYRDEPVYRTRYEYEIDRWVTDDWVVASGEVTGDRGGPFWPELHGLESDQRRGDGRREEYVVVLTADDGDTYRQEPGFNTWSDLAEGDEVVGHMARGGSLRSVDWPEGSNG